MRFVIAAAVAVGLVVLFVGGSVFYPSWSACLGGEGAVLDEFAHHGGTRGDPYPSQGSCVVRYGTRAGRSEVLGHYDQQLRKNGWEVLGFQAYHPYRRGVGGEYDRLSGALKTPESAVAGLAARRNGYNYWVSYEPPNERDPDLPDDRALVTASVIEGGEPGAFRD